MENEKKKRVLKGMLQNLQVFKGEPLSLQDWLEALQKKCLILGLSDEELVLLANDRLVGSA